MFNPSFIINEFRLKNGIEELSHNYIKSYKDDSIIEGFQSIIVTIDKENVFNRSYIGNDSNIENYVGKSSIDGIIFNEDCLMHIKKVKNKKGIKENKLTEVFAGDEEILKKFSKMVETK